MGDGVKVKMDVDKAIVAIHEAQEDVKNALAAAVYQTGLKILRDSARLAPVDTGRLRNSRFGSVPMPDNPEMVVGYGVQYARRQHEENATKAKFLQRPFEKEATLQKIAARTAKNYNAGRSIAGVPSGGLPTTAGQAAHDAKAGPSRVKKAKAKAKRVAAAAERKKARAAKAKAKVKAKRAKKVAKVKKKITNLAVKTKKRTSKAFKKIRAKVRRRPSKRPRKR